MTAMTAVATVATTTIGTINTIDATQGGAGQGRPLGPFLSRLRHLLMLACAGAAVSLLAATSAFAAGMCVTEAAGGPRLGATTSRASAAFLEAASRMFLVFRALEVGEDFRPHATETAKLLEIAAAGYRDARALDDDLHEADEFLRERPFDRLRRSLGITPGTLSHTRWDIVEKTARESKTPARDLLFVCEAGAGHLRNLLATLTPDMNRVMLRKASSTWYAVLAHGALISDAFDTSVR